MSVYSKVNNSCCESEVGYPCLMIDNSDGTIALFLNTEQSVTLRVGGNCAGEEYVGKLTDWCEEYFILFNGTVTLSNKQLCGD